MAVSFRPLKVAQLSCSWLISVNDAGLKIEFNGGGGGGGGSVLCFIRKTCYKS